MSRLRATGARLGRPAGVVALAVVVGLASGLLATHAVLAVWTYRDAVVRDSPRARAWALGVLGGGLFVFVPYVLVRRLTGDAGDRTAAGEEGGRTVTGETGEEATAGVDGDRPALEGDRPESGNPGRRRRLRLARRLARGGWLVGRWLWRHARRRMNNR